MNWKALLLHIVWIALVGLMICTGRHDLALWMLLLAVTGILVGNDLVDRE
jgi:4-hydroxybenzoate polyprenyltransferase